MRLPATLTLAILLLGHAAVPAADDAATLIADLASDDFDVREAAFAALMARSAVVLPQLERALPRADAETAARIEQIRERARPLPLHDCETIAHAMNLFLGDDPDQRASGLDELLSLGQPGIRLAQQKLTARDVNMRIDAQTALEVLQLGELTVATATAHNAGTDGLWVYDRPHVGLSIDLAVHFSGQDQRVGRCGGGRRLMRRGGYVNPIRNWRYCPPGKIGMQELEIAPETPGIYNIYAWFSLVRDNRIEPRWPDHCNRTLPLLVNAGLPQQQQHTTAQQQLVVLPNFEFPIVDRQLEMRVSGPESAPAGGVLSVELTIQCRDLDARELYLERSFMHCAWYVIVNAANKPVQWGSLESLRDNPDTAEPAPAAADPAIRVPARQLVAPGAPLRLALPVKMPAEAGAYAVIFGYEVGDYGSDWRSTRFLPNETPYIRDDVFLDGKLYTRLETVRVK